MAEHDGRVIELPDDEVELTMHAHEEGVRVLREVLDLMLSREQDLLGEVERRVSREIPASKGELRPLRAAHTALMEARKVLRPEVERREARARAFAKEWFEND